MATTKIPASQSRGNLIDHFPQTQYLDYRSIVKSLGITGQKGVERAVNDHLKKKSNRLVDGRLTRFEVKNGPGSAVFEDGKRLIVRNDGTVKELKAWAGLATQHSAGNRG